MEVGNLNDLPHQELTTKTGERLSLSALLTNGQEHKGIFVHHEILPPGRRASAPHSHSRQEEMVVVLAGQVRAHVGGEHFDLLAGSFLTFAPGGEKHFLENISAQEAKFLVFCSRPAADEISY